MRGFTAPADIIRTRVDISEDAGTTKTRLAQAQRWDSMANVYRQVDTILCSSPVNVKAGDFSHMGLPAPAWNDGSTIYLNTAILRALDDQTLIGINGVNYHEVAHLLYSPRFQSEFIREVILHNMKQTWNMMDDQRIETLLVGRYPSVKESLTHTVLTYLLEDGSAENSFPLLRGRKYLPLEVRQYVADAWVAQHGRDHAQALAKVMDEYRLCIYPRDQRRMLELVKEYHALLNTVAPEQPEDGQGLPQDGQDGQPQPQDGQDGQPQDGSGVPTVSNDGTCNAEANNLTKGEVEPVDAQEQDARNAQADDEDESLETADDDSAANSALADENEIAGSEPESNDESADAIKNAIENAIKDVLDQILQDESVLADLDQMREAIANDNQVVSGIDKQSTFNVSASPKAHSMAEEFARELNELLCDSDATWVSHQSAGRVNMKRAMTMSVNDFDTVFDRWEDGDLAHDIEAVILIDKSSSMSDVMNSANESAWAIKRGLESINADVSVLTFNDSAQVVYSKDERATTEVRKFHALGGTIPVDVLIEAERLLEQSDRYTKILIILSDGDWSLAERCEQVIARINDLENVITASVFMPDAKEQLRLGAMSGVERQTTMTQRQHLCHSITTITDPSELVNVARDICRGIMM